MPAGYSNLVLETSTNPGTGSFVLNGAPADRIAFATAFASGQTIYYFADDGSQTEWGIGTLTTGSPNVLARTTVRGTTANSTSPLNFTGVVTVYCEAPASLICLREMNGDLLLGAGNTNIAKTDGNQSQALASFGNSGVYTALSSAASTQLANVSFTALAKCARLDFRAAVSFDAPAGGYTMTATDYAQVNVSVAFYNPAGTVQAQAYDVVRFSNLPFAMEKITVASVQTGMTAGTNWLYRVTATMTGSNSNLRVRIDAAQGVFSQF